MSIIFDGSRIVKSLEEELREAEKNYQQRDFKSAYERYLSLATN